MLRIHGPTYRYQNEIIKDEIIYIDDHHYDEHTHSFPVAQLLEHNPGNHLLVFDHLAHDDVLHQYRHVILPVYLAREVKNFLQQDIHTVWTVKTHCFNFMINKPRPNRFIVLDFVEKHKLTNRCYTLPWQKSRWPNIAVTDYRIGNEIVMELGVKNGSYSNAETYQKLLQKSVFEPTCVSMITEPCYYERESMITEKTVMAIMGGTLPVWVGGWRLPDVMRDLGFDVFDDIVDHSYSTLSCAQDRAQQALIKNLRLFQDFNYVRDVISNSHDRLMNNLRLIKNNVFLTLVKNQCQANLQLSSIANLWGLSTRC